MSNNCYSYAFNNQTQYNLLHDSFDNNHFMIIGMQPGALGGIALTNGISSKDDLLELLEYDKSAIEGITLIKAGIFSTCPENGYKVALWYDSSGDYHWYRQNSDGTWSHKPGELEVTNLDTHGNLIVDAVHQNTLYDTFVGFYYVVPFNVIAPLDTAPIKNITVIGFYPRDFS